MELNESTTHTFAASLQALFEADGTFVLPEAPKGENSSQGQVVRRMLACQQPMAAELRQFAEQQRSKEEVPGLELLCRLGLLVSSRSIMLLSCPATKWVGCWQAALTLMHMMQSQAQHLWEAEPGLKVLDANAPQLVEHLCTCCSDCCIPQPEVERGAVPAVE